jgi:hypothetical protein
MLGHKSPGNSLRLPPLTKSLSAKLLLLTIAFVMLAEVMIYAPSIGRMRLVYLEERLAAAHLSILALEATPDNMVSKEMEAELLQHVGAYMVALTKPELRLLLKTRHIASHAPRRSPGSDRSVQRECFGCQTKRAF